MGSSCSRLYANATASKRVTEATVREPSIDRAVCEVGRLATTIDSGREAGDADVIELR